MNSRFLASNGTATSVVGSIALISVFDKKGLAPFAKGLVDLGFEIVSSGGTAKFLKQHNIKVKEVADLTKYPQMLSGRVKTLHPIIHAGILADRSNSEHWADLRKYKIDPIDLVVVNLYPFEQVTSDPKCTIEKAIENIDIGGPTMLRAAAKNHKSVGVVVDPDDYYKVLHEMRLEGGELSLMTKQKLALKVFQHTMRYDTFITRFLERYLHGEELFPKYDELLLEKIQDLRYGENPHQRAAYYREAGTRDQGSEITDGKQLQGKELSFNNIVDMNAAWEIANYFTDTTVAIIKHTNPCGIATASTVKEAYAKALECDPASAYGSVIAVNRIVDEDTAKEMAKLFVEIVIAPAFSKAALKVFKDKQNLRLIEMGEESINKPFKGMDFKRVGGGFVVQEADIVHLNIGEVKIVTKKAPSVEEMEDLFFTWGVVKHVKSNSIVVGKNGQAFGVGAGQMSRVEAAEIAIKKAGDKVSGCVMASDAFFPFPDCVELAAKAGVTAIIQPGGSKRDQESIDACDKLGIAMVFTGRRHFKH